LRIERGLAGQCFTAANTRIQEHLSAVEVYEKILLDYRLLLAHFLSIKSERIPGAIPIQEFDQFDVSKWLKAKQSRERLL
jgi:hypothetical protein